MDRREFRKVCVANKTQTSDKLGSKMTIERNAARETSRPHSKHPLLKGLSADLALRAEKMKLLSRAEEGLETDNFNSYVESLAQNEFGDTADKLGKSMKPTLKTSSVAHKCKKQPSQIPTPTARQRRREKVSKVHTYRPGYTWDRGGRLKELRIRHLARKFLAIWTKKVYGRILPSVARNHYQQRLKRLAFREWYDMWWELRKEWRLNVRADCHHRYTLFTMIFRNWKKFVVLQRIKASKMALAVKHSDQKLTRRVLCVWVRYKNQQRDSHRLQQIADQFHSHCVLRHTWTRWQTELSVTYHRQEMEVMALQFWSYRIQAQHWILWCEKVQRRRERYYKFSLAVRHHNLMQRRKALQGWIMYWQHRKERNRLNECARLLYWQSLKNRVFRMWIQQYNMCQSIKAQEDYIQTLAQRFQLRRALEHWKYYVKLQLEDREKQAIAEHHYQHKLKLLGMSCFRLNVVQRHVQWMRKSLALRHYHTQLLRRHWEVWLTGCEANEELEMIPLTRKAQALYKENLLRKSWESLLIYTTWRQHRKSQYARADAHFYFQAMPRFLFRMQMFVQIVETQRQNQEKCEDFRRENLLSKYFYEWYTSFEQSKDDRMYNTMAVLHHESCLKKRFMQKWKSKTQEMFEQKEKEEYADEHLNSVLLRNHLKAWKQLIVDIKTNHFNEARAAKHYYVKILSKVMTSLKQYTRHRQDRKEKTSLACRHRQRRLCKQAVQEWKAMAFQGRQFKLKSEESYQTKCAQTLRWALHTWKANVEAQIEEKLMEQTADLHCHRQLLQKTLRTWHRFAAIHAYKKSETRQWVNATHQILMQNKLKRYFQHWQLAREQSLLENLRWEQAVAHHQRHVRQMVINTWVIFTKESHRKKLLMSQCVWFHNLRLTVQYFAAWKQAHTCAIEENRKTGLALWHWSLVLQRKVLVGWRVETLNKQGKKKRLLEALDRRRNRLIRNGVTQWLTVATDLSEMRSKFAAQQHAKDAFAKHQLIERCALHWRHWAAKRKASREEYRRDRQSAILGAALDKDKDVFYLKVNDIPGKRVQGGTQLPPPVLSKSPGRPKHFLTDVVFSDQRLPSRKKPRHPAFLADSLKRAGLFVQSDTDQSLTGSHPTVPKIKLQRNSDEEGTSAVSDSKHVTGPAHKQTLICTSSELSDAESLPRTFSPPPVTLVTNLPQNVRKLSLSPQGEDCQTGVQFSHKLTYKHLIDCDEDETKRDVKSNQSGLRLLTPADFMSKQVIGAEIEVTPLSTPRTVDLESIDMPRLGDYWGGDEEKESINVKIIKIRNRLKEFERKKKRLRKLQKQHQQISDWIRHEESKAEEDLELVEVKQEITEMETEMKDLTTFVVAEKSVCAELVHDVKKLVTEFKQIDSPCVSTNS